MSQEFQSAFARFLQRAQAIVDAYYAQNFPKNTVPELVVEAGKRYVRVVKRDSVSRSAYCFVDTANGDVLKPAGWKGPAKGARGNIYTDQIGVNHHGALYAR